MVEAIAKVRLERDARCINTRQEKFLLQFEENSKEEIE
jgi:hypothetical protein